MARMQSIQSQCCCCSISVFSALFGIIMLSTGICLVLNYRIMEVDTTGLPPQWQNEEGKRIVGIILICCGLGGMGLSALMTALYFTVCSKSKTTTSVSPSGQNAVQRVDKTAQQSPSDPYSTEVTNKHHGQTKTNSSRHGKRAKKKRPQLKTYKTRLAPHQEVINESEPRHEHVELDESSRSLDSSQSSSSKSNSFSGDRREAAGGVDETSLQTDPFVLTPGNLPRLLNEQAISETKSPPLPASSVQEDELPKLSNERDLLHGEPPPSIPETTINDDVLPKHSHQKDILKPILPPAVSASSLQNDDDEEEEEVSQIEEIKKLDKDVANLLV